MSKKVIPDEFEDYTNDLTDFLHKVQDLVNENKKVFSPADMAQFFIMFGSAMAKDLIEYAIEDGVLEGPFQKQFNTFVAQGVRMGILLSKQVKDSFE